MALAKVLTDFHHSSLLRSTIKLFEGRLGMEVYRPIGLQWYAEGFWRVNENYDTAAQFLSLEQVPKDHTAPLNNPKHIKKGIYYCYDAGGVEANRACTLEFFKKKKFDYIIASIPAHVPVFELLRRRYQPKAKLIVQLGNEWPDELFVGHNVLASIKPRPMNARAVFYHQEFDLDIFKFAENQQTRMVKSYVNVLANMPQAQDDFDILEATTRPFGYTFQSYGGQNRDGNMNGPRELAASMAEADFVLHSKPGGDGYGHVIHNAYAVGRPVILRRSHYRNRLAESLLAPGTFIDLDELMRPNVATLLESITQEQLTEMSEKAYRQFNKVVDFDREAKEIASWLTTL